MKQWHQSKTIWFNLASLMVLAGSGGLGFTIPTEYAVPFVTTGNLILRFITTGAIIVPVGSLTPPDEAG